MGMERPTPGSKKAKKASKVMDDDWAEEDASPAKKKKNQEGPAGTQPELLESGAVVLYWDGWRGVVRDAFVPLDEFWVADEESGAIVRDDNGDIVHFKSSELELIAGPPIAPPPKPGTFGGPAGGVILIGTEHHMMKMLSHFGSPDAKERHEPQMLLAFPCNLCDGNHILETAGPGIDKAQRKLAQSLRTDIHVALRTYHLRQAIQEMGSDLLRMDDFYLMTTVSMPYSWNDIESCPKGSWWKKWRRDVCNQIDVGPLRGFHDESDATPEDTARRTLGLQCGVEVSMVLWDAEVQTNLRQQLDVDLPLHFNDVNDGKISVILLPTDAVVTTDEGIVRFIEAPDAEYLAAVELEAEEPEEQMETQQQEVEKKAASGPGGKTIAEWEKEQDQFQHLPKPPPGWLRIKSQKSGEIYFYNRKTKESTFDMPQAQLPPGWTKEVSKSTGKTYYFHAAKRKSQFHFPTE